METVPDTITTYVPQEQEREEEQERELRLRTAELFALTLIRLWMTAQEGDAAEGALRRAFVDAGLDGAAAGALETILLILSVGRRPLRYAVPGAAYVTDDELRLLMILAEAQNEEPHGASGLLSAWLAPAASRSALTSIEIFAYSLSRIGLRLRPCDEMLASFGFGPWGSSAVVLAPRLSLTGPARSGFQPISTSQIVAIAIEAKAIGTPQRA